MDYNQTASQRGYESFETDPYAWNPYGDDDTCLPLWAAWNFGRDDAAIEHYCSDEVAEPLVNSDIDYYTQDRTYCITPDSHVWYVEKLCGEPGDQDYEWIATFTLFEHAVKYIRRIA